MTDSRSYPVTSGQRDLVARLRWPEGLPSPDDHPVSVKLRIEAADEIEKLRRNLRHWREECGKVSGGVAQGWRDISTAPKDGSTIDLWCLNISHGSTDSVRVPDAFWDDEVSKWEDRHGWILESKWRPTHWMPLPTGPSVPSTVSEPAQAAPATTREGICPSCQGHGVVRAPVNGGPYMSIAERESHDNEGEE